MSKKNIILIGMSGAGKSTLGVILAKELAYAFVDTDLLIQEKYGKPLQAILDQEGNQAFAQKEEEVLSGLVCDQTVISTGGSAIYYPKAMAHLKAIGHIVYLQVPYQEVLRRIGSAANRGILIPPGLTLVDLCRQRQPLYRQYADMTLEVGQEESQVTVNRLKKELEKLDF